ncbi:hypothetical protein STEG23_036819 [Scotinomys teguina]
MDEEVPDIPNIPTLDKVDPKVWDTQNPSIARHHLPVTIQLQDPNRTQEHPDAITPQGPRSTQTPSHHKDPGGTWHLDAITPQGPRNTQTPLQHKPHTGTQEHQTPLD